MSSDEQKISIQPHPATTNDPTNDPAFVQSGFETEAQAAHRANPGPSILSTQQASNLEQPLSKEEIAKRAAELNK